MTYQGSKVKYAKYICPILQKCINDNQIDTFVDVCVGGANIIKNISALNRIGIDKNKYLIALWKELQSPNFTFPPFPSREDWDRCKNGEEERDWYVGLVQIFTSYLCRGFAGGYNKEEKQYWGRVHTVQKDLSIIKNIVFRCDSFEIMKKFNNTVMYCDIPYANTKRYDVDKHFDYDAFWECARIASKNNYVFVSEQSAPEDFCAIWSLDTNRQLQGNITACTENLFIYNNPISLTYKGE